MLETPETPEEALKEAIRHAGGAAALARQLGIRQPSISGWKVVPALRVRQLERLTGVSRARLRPDLYGPDANPAAPSDDLPASEQTEAAE